MRLLIFWQTLQTFITFAVCTSGTARGRVRPPPKLGSQENSWLHRWAKYTKLCIVWQPNILNNCYEFREDMPRTTHQGGSGGISGDRWGTSIPQTPCAPHQTSVPRTSKSWLRHWYVLLYFGKSCVPNTVDKFLVHGAYIPELTPRRSALAVVWKCWKVKTSECVGILMTL